jgi:enoyl-CoA hydratase
VLRATFRAFDNDDSQSVAVLTGTEGKFCAGYDLTIASQGGGGMDWNPGGNGAMGPTRMMLSKPVIVAEELVREIIKFQQICMRNDQKSSYKQ